MKLATALLLLGCSAAVIALPAVDPAATAAPPTTTKPPGIPPAVVDLISSRLDALATVPGAPGAAVGPAMAPAMGGPFKPTAVPPPGVPPAVAKLIKTMLKSYAAPAVA